MRRSRNTSIICEVADGQWPSKVPRPLGQSAAGRGTILNTATNNPLQNTKYTEINTQHRHNKYRRFFINWTLKLNSSAASEINIINSSIQFSFKICRMGYLSHFDLTQNKTTRQLRFSFFPFFAFRNSSHALLWSPWKESRTVLMGKYRRYL